MKEQADSDRCAELIRSPKTGPLKIRAFRSSFPWVEEAEEDESVTVLGCPEGVHFEAG
jgi:hypothetical protein